MDFAHSTFFHAQKYDFRFDTLEKFGTRFLGFRLVTKFNRAPTFFGTRSSIPFWFQFIHAFSLMETWGHLKEIWFPLRETWVHLREIWFPLKEAWIHLKETWFLLKETRSHLTVSAGSLPVPEPMAVASALVFLWKASIFGTSNFAMDSNPFFTFFQIRDFSRLKKKRLKTSAIYFRCTWTVTKFNIFLGRCFLSVSFPWIGYRVCSTLTRDPTSECPTDDPRTRSITARVASRQSATWNAHKSATETAWSRSNANFCISKNEIFFCTDCLRQSQTTLPQLHTGRKQHKSGS